MSEVRLELLLGHMVHDAEGRRIGRLDEVVAAEHEGECRVLEYHLGSYGLLESVGALGGFAAALARFLGIHQGFAVPWDRMDLSDPERPRVTCRKEELARL
jgi:hypothetical protein